MNSYQENCWKCNKFLLWSSGSSSLLAISKDTFTPSHIGHTGTTHIHPPMGIVPSKMRRVPSVPSRASASSVVWRQVEKCWETDFHIVARLNVLRHRAWSESSFMCISFKSVHCAHFLSDNCSCLLLNPLAWLYMGIVGMKYVVNSIYGWVTFTTQWWLVASQRVSVSCYSV